MIARVEEVISQRASFRIGVIPFFRVGCSNVIALPNHSRKEVCHLTII